MLACRNTATAPLRYDQNITAPFPEDDNLFIHGLIAKLSTETPAHEKGPSLAGLVYCTYSDPLLILRRQQIFHVQILLVIPAAMQAVILTAVLTPTKLYHATHNATDAL